MKLYHVLKNIVQTIAQPMSNAEIDAITNVATTPVADYVVEQGTSGVWTYRKWNSGIAECWCRTTKTLTAGSVWSSPVYYYQFDSIAYPFTFVSVPTEHSSPINGENAFWTYKESAASSGFSTANNTTTATARYGLLKLNAFNNGATATISIVVKGRWK